MKIPKLEIGQDGYEYVIRWVMDDGELGGQLGEVTVKAPKTQDDIELMVAHEAGKLLADRYEKFRGFFFDSTTKAQNAMRAVRAALKANASAQASKPWPEWAKTAAAAGWRPPKGWTP